ncbi:hypothetical protein COU17_02125 [Candidatus Kaiserbacteria bacterium CG10_big_fil_rev_8_21_14_0_10_49_17]|uniref:Nudix hydrolase domain-containing protein n=1 Tax=Candidatus Kaiserbacteria bacterium CG10_big_fil_rev_8_21_14_0_10_49_17 TaxID=1974609 RepID=A0A2M6WED8_9BACT|nr:MAG: hypothetical protein COU17_02125 [Candidatus Kaiserbacteria bacterium CG10_big_fil_rev_8_21_14_0_10_49_17]
MTQMPEKRTVRVLILSLEGLVLVKSRYKHCWELPGGRIEYGEKPVDAATREVFEETALIIWPENFTEICQTVRRGNHIHLFGTFMPEIRKETLPKFGAVSGEEVIMVAGREIDWLIADRRFHERDIELMRQSDANRRIKNLLSGRPQAA